MDSSMDSYRSRLRTPQRTSCGTPLSLSTGRSSLYQLRDTVKRNLNESFGSPDHSPVKSPKKSAKKTSKNESPGRTKNTSSSTKDDLTLVINKKSKTCRFKRILNESESEDEKLSDDLTDKRKIKSPTKRLTILDDDDDFDGGTFSPSKKHTTPLKNKLPKDLLSDNVTKTPKGRRTSVSTATPKTTTPRNRLKMIRDGLITPSVQSRAKAIKLDGTPLMKARNQLHVSFIPEHLPCRENEYSNILKFLIGKLQDKCGGCMYISGVPGTGKTATVTAVMAHLEELYKRNEVRQFEFIKINGMKLTEPRQAYVEILKQLTGKTVAWGQAQEILDAKFTKKSKKPQLPIILLVDELDIICNKRQDVVYNLMDWPTKTSTQLIIVTIANTMDLPERLLMNRVTSRLGLTRLPFQAYTHKQLQEIVTNRLSGTNSFNPDAVQLVSRKVASVSGDARRALDICRRAAEIAQKEGEYTLVTMSHVDKALNAMIAQPKVRAIKACSVIEQHLLQAIVAESERTGVEETFFPNVFKMLSTLLTLNGVHSVSCSVVLRALAKLNSCRLVLVDQKCHDMDQKVILNLSPDDVYYALKEE